MRAAPATLAFVATVVALTSCDALGVDRYDPDRREREASIGIAVKAESAVADGGDSHELTATVLWEGTAADGAVTFVASAGTFVRSGEKTVSVVLDSVGTAHAALQATAPGEVVVSVSAGSLVRDTTVSFGVAYPDTVVVDAGAFEVKAGLGNAVNVTVTARRSAGTVSSGVPVSLTAVRGDGGGEIGTFRGASFLSDAGTATATFTAGDTEYRGGVTIRASVGTATGMVAGQTTLTVRDP